MKKTELFPHLLAACMVIQLFVGTALADSSVAASIIKSRLILAEKGNVDAQFKLASMYELGIGTKVNSLLSFEAMETEDCTPPPGNSVRI